MEFLNERSFERQVRVLASLCVVLFFLWALPAIFVFVFERYEDISLKLFPSASSASSFGALHMSSVHPYLYDLNRAQKLYEYAIVKSSTYPYAHHQLARIYFLEGKLNKALAEINTEIALHGDTETNTYYMRGLIEGYMGSYTRAAQDYERFVSQANPNWAGYNDYVWTLLKSNQTEKAAIVLQTALSYFPNNPWLLNTEAITLYERGDYDGALRAARTAVDASRGVSQEEWLTAYPGNDARAAREGISTLQRSALENMHMIETAQAKSRVQLQ